MTMATLALGGFTLFYLFLYVCIELMMALQWLLFVRRRLQIQTCSEIKKMAWEKPKTQDYIKRLHRS